ncbi:MAG: histidine kinase dimerization/phospho-acceptor domain-containing protein, partial [Nitrospirota bacterium]
MMESVTHAASFLLSLVRAAFRRGPSPALSIAVILFCWVPSALSGERTVAVGVYENAPKVFTSGSGKPSGIFVDIIEHIAEAEGWKLHYVSGTWAEGLARLAKGQIDLMVDVAYTTEREKVYAFHKVPVLTGWSQVYARRDSGIRSILDLNGKRVGALEQTIQIETFRRMTNSFGLNITLVPMPDYKTEFEMLAAGAIDAGLTNRLYGLMYARKYGLEDTPIMFDPAPFFYAAPRNASHELLDAIDRHLEKMKKDPRSAYYAAMKQWTAEEVQFKLQAWVKVLGLVLGAAVVVVLSLVIGKQHAAERSLRKEKAFAETIIDSVPGAFYVIDATGRLVRWNRYLEKLNDLSPEELRGMDSLRNIHVDDKDRIARSIREAFATGQAETEARIMTAEGERYFLFTGRRINIDEAPLVVGSGIEITSRRRAEQELVRYKDHLEELVRERTATLEETNAKLQREIGERARAEHDLRAALEDLAVAKERAEAADRLKSAFLATMSHELRTPLNSIIGFTGILRQELAGPLNEEQKKQMEMVQKSSDHLLALINDVLDISKIEAGQLQVASAAFDMKASVLKIVNTVRPLAEKKGLELAVEIGPGVGIITSDQRRVEQVLLNMLSNAIKYT